MSEFKGTKGYWTVEQCKEFETLHLIWSTSEKSILDNGTLIARTCYAPLSKANAQIIAHAPQMLEMLIEAKQQLQSIKLSMMAHPDCTEGSEFEDYTSSAQECEDEIEQLIQQATTIK